jgi:hypothetical protein
MSRVIAETWLILFDYRVRYKAEVAGAQPVLAFGAPPDRATGWITTILQGNGIGFIARDRERLVPLTTAPLPFRYSRSKINVRNARYRERVDAEDGNVERAHARGCIGLST